MLFCCESLVANTNGFYLREQPGYRQAAFFIAND
jgi:hypothetical protein